jgi:probable blue pigment (indigoidine) exporter
MPPQSKTVPALAAALASVFWGSNYIVVTQLLSDHPFFIAAVRSVGGALPLLLLYPRLPSVGWWGKIAILGTLNCGAFFALLFVSALRLPGGIAGTLQSIGPIFTIVIAWAALGERPRFLKLGLLFAGATGVALLLISGRAPIDWLGAVAGLGAALCLAAGGILMNRWPRPAPLAIFTGWQLAVGGLELTLLAALVGDLPASASVPEIMGLAYLAIFSTTIAYSLWFYCIGAAGAAVAAPFLLLSPLVAFTLDALIRGLLPTAQQAIGASIVLASLLAGQVADRR